VYWGLPPFVASEELFINYTSLEAAQVVNSGENVTFISPERILTTMALSQLEQAQRRLHNIPRISRVGGRRR
jgi:hypothetical protein